MELMVSFELLKGDLEVADELMHIPCPCAKCRNRYRDETFWVKKHLYDHRFVDER